VILLGGIYTGVFTPTEAAAVAAVYALLVGLFIYREVKPRDLRRVLMNTVINTAIVLFVMGAASVFGWVLTVEQIPLKLTEYFLSLHLQPWSLLLILNILFLILGCFMEINTILLIFLPIILPVLQRFGIDLVHFGVVMVLNLMIGTITPPFGMIMYITSGIAKVSMAEVIKELVPFYIVLIAVLMLITYVPQIVLFLPNLLFK
jgi:tripartite ATP-independent transporter DctM subunit